jgi:hypothetical protein
MGHQHVRKIVVAPVRFVLLSNTKPPQTGPFRPDTHKLRAEQRAPGSSVGHGQHRGVHARTRAAMER